MRLVFSVVLAGVVGCGSSGEPRAPVAGKVLWRGQPLSSGAVVFRPDAAKGNDSKEVALSPIDAEGNYRLNTRIKEGVAPGWYNVAVTAAEETNAKDPYFTEWLIPQKYINPRTSNLRFEVVKEPAPGAYDIKLAPKTK